ncbi:hypothetical protein PoB_000111000 [Plakobranchus ocellatus]|uniref:EGF-like domain-containing protein n=1 Tax=Plakobranchus ocellatus TaxID=259542 RepID=A0AAV3XW10_9GAST|nr:hypothetical protein PoB_000111000 [Plakobranchus ocellatus]
MTILLALVPERAAEQTTTGIKVRSFSFRLTQYYGFQEALNSGCLSIASSGTRSLIDCAMQCLSSCPGFIFSETGNCYLLKTCYDLHMNINCCPALNLCETPDVLFQLINEVIDLYYNVNFCLNDGTWNLRLKSCTCPFGKTGVQCENDFNTFNLSNP